MNISIKSSELKELKEAEWVFSPTIIVDYEAPPPAFCVKEGLKVFKEKKVGHQYKFSRQWIADNCQASVSTVSNWTNEGRTVGRDNFLSFLSLCWKNFTKEEKHRCVEAGK